MPYTSHGYWFGPMAPRPGQPEPPLRARCGGPGICPDCARESGADLARRPVTRRRFATRAELAERMAVHMRGANDMDVSWEDLALAALEGLAEMHVPVDALVKITVEEET